MIDTTRRYPRSLRDAFPTHYAGVTVRTDKLHEFAQIYRLYRRAAHGRLYSARIAYGIVYRQGGWA